MNVKALVTKFSRQTGFFFFTKFPLKTLIGMLQIQTFLTVSTLLVEKCDLLSCTFNFLRFRQFVDLFLVSRLQIHFFAIFKG